MRHAALITLLLSGFSVFVTSPVFAASSITLAWNPSSGTNIAGYRIHYGGSSHSYTNMVSAAASTTATVSGLKDGTTYYFAATAYDSSGLESDYSNEASTTTPAPTNQPPTLNAITDVTINEDAGAQAVALSGISSGSATESQTLVVTAVSGNTSLIANPSITYTSPNATGTLNFTPVANASGSTTITVTVNDGGASNNIVTRTFNVTVNAVNDAPTLTAISNLTINENASAQSVNLAGISSGAANESQTLTVTATSSNPGLIPNPTVTYTSPNATGTLSFTPVALMAGTATITVTVNDGAASNNTFSRTFTVTVSPVNQPPTLNALANLTINENATAQTVNLSGISTGATNESQTLTVTATSSSTSVVPNPTVTYSSPNATGTLSFTPVANAFGSATITVTVNDGQAQNNTVTRTFTVTVSPVNQQPTLNALNNVTINENAGAQTVSLAGISSGAANESQTLTITATSSNTGLIPNPTVTYTSPNATGSLSFTPVSDMSGNATITVTVNDGQAQNNTVTRTFTVTVNAVNSQPTLSPIANLTINENAGQQSVAINGISSGSPNELQTLTVTASSSNPGLIPNPTVTYTSPNTSGTVAFTPTANVFGSSTITVTVNDGGTSNNIITHVFTVTVNPVNQPPTLNGISNLAISENAGQQTVNLSGISSGAANESQTLTVTATSGNTGLIPNPTVNYTSPNATGTLTFTPVAFANGSTTVTVKVNDGGASNNIVTRTFTVTVNSVNQAPTISEIVDQATSQDTATAPIPFTIGDTETAASNLTLVATSDNVSVVPTNNIVFGGSDSNRTVTITPASGQSGDANITITVSDGSATASTTFLVSVVAGRPANTPPTISAIPDQTVSQNTPTAAIPFTVGDAESDASSLSVSATSSDTNLLPVSNIVFGGGGSNRTVTIMPAGGALGSATVTITVSDGDLSSSSALNFTVNPASNQIIPNLTVLVVGNGKVTPNLMTQKLTIGRSYTVSAIPSPGQAFAGWSGSITSMNTRLSFVLRSNTVLQATFVPVTFATSGTGTLSPNLATSTGLIVGKTYAVSAMPGAGQIFIGWSGAVTSTLAKISVLVTPGMSLQANFIPNPYLPVVGTYNGLFHEGDAVRPNSAGSFIAAVTSSGAYSGSVQLGTNKLSFSGKLDLSLQGTSMLTLKGTNLTLHFQFGTGDQADQVFGSVSSDTWGSGLVGDRAVFTSVKGHTAPTAGAYTVIFPGQDGNPGLPGGDGFGTIHITTAGVATFTGTLADGTTITRSAPISKNGEWPLYIPLYSGQGCIMSWLTFTNEAADDLTGAVSWIKPANTNAAYYPAGFAYDFDAAGSIYHAPASPTVHILSVTNASVEFAGGNLAADFTNSIVIANYSKVSNLSSNKLSLTFSLTAGTFSGTVVDPGSGTVKAFSGAVFQKQNVAFGFLKGTNQTSQVFITP